MNHLKFLNSKIYSIRNVVDDKIYVGSTTESLRERMAYHCKMVKEGKSKINLYKAMKNYGSKSFEITLLERCCYHSSVELRARTKYWIRKLKSNDSAIGYNQRAKHVSEPFSEEAKEYIREWLDKQELVMKEKARWAELYPYDSDSDSSDYD